MSIASEIERLQGAKSALKTAIEGKGVSVPASTKLDGYSALVNSIEQGGGGGGVPYIVNPFNGGNFPSAIPNAAGDYTHQYVVSDGNIVDAWIVSFISEYNDQNVYSYNTGDIDDWDYDEYYKDRPKGKSMLTISDTGLLNLNLSTGGYSGVGGWNIWKKLSIILFLDSGYALRDSVKVYMNYSCFVKGTKISLANGEKINVEDVDYDAELLVWNFDEGKYDSAKPLWIKRTETTTWYYKLKFSNGLELNVTGTYPEAHSLFSVEDGKFIHANKLVGKKVYTLDGIATLESCEEVHENVEFYNIITNYHMNLFANNVLTSTSLNNLYLIKDMKFVKEDREPVFDYTQFSDDWIVGARLKEQPTDVTKYCLDHIKLSKC